MLSINDVEIDIDSKERSEVENIYTCLKMLFTTAAGTVPFDRGFGIDFDILDNPLPIARGKLIVEYIEKTKKYEPRAFVERVDFIENSTDGSLYPKVVIKLGDKIG